MSDIYMQKFNNVFQRLNSAQEQIQDDKISNKTILLNNIKLLEEKIQLVDQYSQEGFDDLQRQATYLIQEQKLKLLLDDQQSYNDSMNQNFSVDLEILEKRISGQIQRWIDETQNQNKQKYDHIQQSLEQVLLDADKIENESAQRQKQFYTHIFEEIFPQINQDLDKENHELDAFEREFESQISKSFGIFCYKGLLRKELQFQRNDSANFQESFEGVLKRMQESYLERVDQLKKDRVQKQDNMLKLIDQIVSKIKDDLMDSDEDQ